MIPTLPLYDQARCIHPPSVECYAIQAFSIASDFDPQLMPKIQNQIAMRKVSIVIQSLPSRNPNHHSSYSQDRQKHHTLLILKRRKNVVHDVTNVEQHPRRLRRAFRHSRTNSASPKGLRRPSAFGSDLRRGKVRLALRLHTASPVKALPKYVSLLASQWLSRSGIPRPPLRVRWIQTCLRTIGLAPPQSNLERDRCNANRRSLGRGSTANR